MQVAVSDHRVCLPDHLDWRRIRCVIPLTVDDHVSEIEEAMTQLSPELVIAERDRVLIQSANWPHAIA